jgi:hypothetical protein
MAKKTIIGVFFIAFCQFAFCQTEILKMNEWTERYVDIGYVYNATISSYAISGDTTINSVKYRKFYKNGKIHGAIRETADSLVYFYNTEYKREFLLYDFAWRIGKTIKSVDLCEWAGADEDIPEYVYATIDKIDTLVLEYGKKYAYITTSFGTKCIQGIGDTEGFTAHLCTERPTCYCSNYLWCAFDTRMNCPCPLYKNEDCNDCFAHITSTIEMPKDNSYIKNNPVKDYLTLTLPTDNNEIKIFDLQGKLLLQQEVGQTAQITVSMLQTGTYVLIINNSESLTFVKQ